MIESLMQDAPDFSPAMSGMVQINNMEHIVYPGFLRDAAKHLEDASDRATRRPSRSARLARAAQPRVELPAGRPRPRSARFTRALATELNENDPWTLMSAAQIFAYCGDYAQAEALASASLELTRSPTRRR